MQKTLNLNFRRASINGFLFAIPFVVMNFVVSLRIEPFYSLLGSYPGIRNAVWLPLLLLLLFPIGAYVSVKPLLSLHTPLRTKLLSSNVVVAVVLMLFFLVVFYGLFGDLYRCEVLRIPNCD